MGFYMAHSADEKKCIKCVIAIYINNCKSTHKHVNDLTIKRHNSNFINYKNLSYVRKQFWVMLPFEERKKTNIRYIHLRITVDGIPKETSLKRTWDAERWDPKKEGATGTEEDARVTNFFLNTLVTKINQYKNDFSERKFAFR